jgi:hypothetical protein
VRTKIGLKAHEVWQPWFGEMGKAIESLKITTTNQWVSCCRKLADGLKQVE